MDRHAPLAGRMLAELDADPAVAALRRRGATATAGEFRAMRGGWAAAVLRALWRGAFAGRAGTVPRTALGARR